MISSSRKPKTSKQQFAGCADRWEQDADYRQCMQEFSRAYETMESCDRIASEPQKIHKMTPQQGQPQFGIQWHVVSTTAMGSNTIPTRQHPELGHAHRARMDCFTPHSGRPLAKQEVPIHNHNRGKNIFESSSRDQESCYLRGVVESNTLTLCMFEHGAPSFSVALSASSSDSRVAVIFSVFQFEVEQNLNGSRFALGARKSTSWSCHIRSCLSFTTQIVTAQCTLAPLSSTLFLSTTVGCASVAEAK